MGAVMTDKSDWGTFYKANDAIFIKTVIALLSIAVAVILASSRAYPQEHQHPTGEAITPAQARLYEQWRTLPDRAMSCCS
jgi:hypothetical protein